jgi:hypothetical protein
MITKFKIFEIRLSDQFQLKSDSNSQLSDIIHRYQEERFNIDRKFQKFFKVDRKIRFTVLWNQSQQHDIYDKIEKRQIGVKSITELNQKIELMLKEIPQLIEDQEIYITGKYGIIFTESNFSVVFFIDLKKYLNKEYEIQIKTIMPMSALSDVIRIIKLAI